MAIREACKNLNTFDLSGCEIYTSCYPCPMCLSAIIWANIKTAYYGNTKEDAEKIGFRDNHIYEYIKGLESKLDVLKIIPIDRERNNKSLYGLQQKENKTIY